jgi:hypothetical protein
MKTRTYLLILILIIGVVIGFVALTPARERIVLRLSKSQPTNSVIQSSAKMVSFEILNNGRSPIMCQDGWALEFEDGSVQRLSLPQIGNIKVEPGKVGTIDITNVVSRRWRLRCDYYVEDIVFHAKVRIELSPLSNQLPASVTSVQGKRVLSDWVN